MAASDDDVGFQEIDGTDTLQRLHSTFNLNRRERPPQMDLPAGFDETRVPLKANKLQRKESKGGLRGMFTRNKAEKNVVSPVVEEPLASAVSEMSMKEIVEANIPRSISIKRLTTIQDPVPVTPASKTTVKYSRMSMRSKPAQQSKPSLKPSPKSSTKSSPKPPTRTSAAWDPPPLFQAYPQAIKHATLSASTLSADSILRISNHKRNNSLRDEIAQTRDPQNTAAARKTEKARSKHRRQISGSISKADWTQKIFVLVTSGYLLQYAGDGSFDRLPEKMMQLGKDSVAFASDVIPGKHWVLQISQAMDADGTPASDSRSLLSRLAFRGADYRRTATSLLLVLNSAEDMDSWIAVVRREIEALGGKKHVSETGKPKSDETEMTLKAQPSHRYLVTRNPDQFSNPSSPQTPSFGPPPWSVDIHLQQKLEDATSALARPQSSIRPSTGHQSVTNSVTSNDERQLESLRDSTNRLSYMSSGQRTLVTSQGSSPESSPTRENAAAFDEFPPKLSTDDLRLRPNASAVNERRRSMQTMQTQILETRQTPKPFRPHSTYSVPIRAIGTRSPTTPNFSVPTSSSKRYSIAKPSDHPHIPTIVTVTPSGSREPMLKGSRKAPPAALSVPRPLSPVNDSPSPKRSPPVFTPTESSFKMLQQIKPSMIDIPPRSPVATTTSPEIEPPRRMSSLMPLSSSETAHIDFKFPRRYSSMQGLRDSVEMDPKAPLRPAPLPPAALTTPLPKSPTIPPNDLNETKIPLETEQESLSALPNLAYAKEKLRRPTSMQIQSSVVSSSYALSSGSKSPQAVRSNNGRPFSVSPSTAPSSTLNYGLTSPAPLSLLSPSIQRLKVQSNSKSLGNRRSMPTLVNGPPPAPPPDCALPPLPPGSAGMRSPISIRSSVRV